MALFPDRIVHKNSVDTRAAIVQAVEAAGSDPIVAGELVVQRSAGSASLLTLDAQGKPVTIGAVSDDTPVAPSIVLNFEEDGTDTPFFYSGATFSTPAKFGAKALNSNPPSTSEPKTESLVISNADDVTLSTGAWTFEFWIIGDPNLWLGLNTTPLTYALIANKSNYAWGPGALNVFLDGGTADRGGVGTTTSYTADQALGSVVFSLTIPGFNHDNTDPLIPSTGEVVTSRSVSVLDNAWHHVAISHEGGGIYSMFIDGQLTQRTVLSGAIDHNDPGSSGISQPSGWDFCGSLIINDEYPDTGIGSGLELPSGRFSIDSVALYQGLAKYKGLYAFDVPTAAVDPTVAVRQPLNTIESLLDTNIPVNPTDGMILVFDEPSGAWEGKVAPPYDISGNQIGDIGDVELVDEAQLTDEDFLRWNTTTQKWVNSGLGLDLLGDVTLTTPVGGQYLYFNSSTSEWQNRFITYDDIPDRPTRLTDLTMDLPSSSFDLSELGDVNVSSVANGNVLVWNAISQRWENETAPAPDLSIANLDDLGDVVSVADQGLSGSRSDFVGLRWSYANGRWEPSEIDYDDINGQPIRLSEFINDLENDDFPNDAGYLTLTDINNSVGPEDLHNTSIVNPEEGQMLIYRSGNWQNELGPPANISFSSIGDLSDVTYFRPTSGVEGELTIEGMGLLKWDSPYQPTNIRFNLNYRQSDQAIGMEAIRDSDETGSSIHVSRGGGVDIRSDVNFIRLRGKPSTVTNRPAVYFETGDSFAAAETGEYIAFQMPDQVDESVLYRLPSADGDPGDVLATDGGGRLSWVSRVSNNSLGQLDDTDLATSLPVDGSSLIYNEAAQLWVPGDPVVEVDLNQSSINELADVDTSSVAPTSGQGLVWNGSAWAPGDVSNVDLGTSSIDDLLDVDTSSLAPADGQGLGWDSASNTWKPMDVAADVSELRTMDLADVSSAAPATGQALIWDGSNWVPSDVQVGEASPAVIWTVSASGSDHYVFEGPGLPEPAHDPTLYVMRGQKYTFDKTISAHPFQVQENQGGGQAPYTRGFNKTQPIGLDTLEWVVPMDAPSTLYYQCTSHPLMSGAIYVLDEGADSIDLSSESIDSLQDVDTSTAAPATGQALVWDGANWAPGDVTSTSGSAISQRVTEVQTSDASGLITYVDLGTSGTMVSVVATSVAWVTLYATEAARTADATRGFGTDPLQGSGVLAEFSLLASTEVLTSPSTNYFNANAQPAEEVYALVRDGSGVALQGVEVTITAYAISGYTGISGGTFGSG